MSDENISELIDEISDDLKDKGDTQIIEIRDGVTETAKMLVPQMGSNRQTLNEGKIDDRRFTNLTELDVLWLSWFSIVPDEYGGEFSRRFCDMFRNHAYSIEAQHKKLIVAYQGAVSGAKSNERKRDNRSFVEKHLTQRKKKPEDEYYDVS